MKALITPELLVWARKRLDFSINEIATLTKMDVEKIKSWENGTTKPTINQAKILAKKLKIPYAFLFLNTPPFKVKLPQNKDYRTIANQPFGKPSSEMQYLLLDIMQKREIILELYQEMEIPLKKFEIYFDAKKNTEIEIAEYIRQLLNLPHNDIKKFSNKNIAFNYYLDCCANLGILVFQTKSIHKKEMKGLSVFEDIFPIIVINRKEEEYATRIFTLIHELIHLITKTPGICNSLGILEKTDFEIELQCNRITAQVLVPEKQLKETQTYKWIKIYGWDDGEIKKLAQQFSVSREVILGRLVSFNDISIDFYNQKLEQYTTEYETYLKNIKKTDGFLPPATDICSQVGKTYARAVINAYNQELITPRDASYFLSGLRLQHFDKVERWCFA